jgi:arsenate reductase
MTRFDLRPALPGDRDTILSLLREAGLPTQDLGADDGVRFLVAERDGRIVGAGGLQGRGDVVLLRSLVVDGAARHCGVGTALVDGLERLAIDSGVSTLVLLTETAAPFFAARGYVPLDRECAPAAIRESAEFRSLCPASALCMSRSLPVNGPVEAPRTIHRVLFLCTGNSCRSILAEATFNYLAPAGWRAMSAGSRPTGRVHTRSLALLAREGIPTDGCASKSWDALPHTPDLVVTVCASAAGEACPAYLGPVLRTHWGVDDPAHATGTDEEIDARFVAAYRTLRRRIEAFLALPIPELMTDRARFGAELDRIAATVN